MTGKEPKGKLTHIIRLRQDELDALNNGVSIQQHLAGAYHAVIKPPSPMIEMGDTVIDDTEQTRNDPPRIPSHAQLEVEKERHREREQALREDTDPRTAKPDGVCPYTKEPCIDEEGYCQKGDCLAIK